MVDGSEMLIQQQIGDLRTKILSEVEKSSQETLEANLRPIFDSLSILKKNEIATQSQLEKFLDDNTDLRNNLNRIESYVHNSSDARSG
jgi:septal ring factor EnvC (AmiA/AmiB activator)